MIYDLDSRSFSFNVFTYYALNNKGFVLYQTDKKAASTDNRLSNSLTRRRKLAVNHLVYNTREM